MSRWGLSEAYRLANDDDVPIVVRRLMLRELVRLHPGEYEGEVAGYMEMLAMIEDAYLTISRETYLWGHRN